MSTIPSLEEMLQAGVHFGHQTSRWHPKMAQFLFGSRAGVHIIDLEQTQKKLEEAVAHVKGIVSRGGSILFVGTKRQAQALVREAAVDCGMPSVTERWLGGTLTNFPQIKRSIKRLKTLKEQQEKGELRKYTKKEQLLLAREIEEMEHKLGGIVNMEKLPEAIFVVDVRHEKTAVEEARTTGTQVIAICDSNINPDLVDVIIPGNDDAVKSIALIVRVLAEAVKEGKAQAVATVVPPKKV